MRPSCTLSFSSFQFSGDDKGYLKSECKDRAVRRGQVFQGKLTPVCEFPFVCFEVKFLFPVQED